MTASAVAQGARLMITAHLPAGRAPVENAAVRANVQMPSISRREVLRKYAARLKEMKLPASVLEKGLKPEQVTLTQLAALAREFRGQPGGLFGRKPLQMELKESAPGTYRAEIPLKADGNVTRQVSAAQSSKKPRWTRMAQASAFCQPLAVSPKPKKTAVAKKATAKKAPAKKR